MSYGYAEANPGAGGPKFAVDDVAGVQTPISKLAYGAEGESTPITEATPLPVAMPVGSTMPTEDAAAGNFLWRILQMLLAPLGYDKSLQRYRQTAIIESGTVTTVTNINGMNGDMLVRGQVNAAWALNVRARIT